MTRRGAVIELAIVTVGVLIALSFDTVREWRANQALAAEARANILSEIRENKTQLDQTLVQLAANRKEYMAAHTAAKNLLAGKPIGVENLNLGNRLASISEAGYQTAEVTGAFAFMDYQEVRDFAGLYALQSKYVQLQDETIANVALLGAPVILANGPDHLSRPELEDWKRSLERAIGYLTIQHQIGTLLSQAYGQALKEAAEPDE